MGTAILWIEAPPGGSILKDFEHRLAGIGILGTRTLCMHTGPPEAEPIITALALAPRIQGVQLVPWRSTPQILIKQAAAGAAFRENNVPVRKLNIGRNSSIAHSGIQATVDKRKKVEKIAEGSAHDRGREEEK